MKPFILLVTAGTLISFGYASGNLARIAEGDQTGIVYAVAMVGIVATALANIHRALLLWLCENQVCPLLGLLGTVLGFMIALDGITGEITAAKLAGVETALTTTAAGMVVHLWLLIAREATRK